MEPPDYGGFVSYTQPDCTERVSMMYHGAMHNQYFRSWLNKRGVTDEVIALFNITDHSHPTIGECIRIPITDSWSKYRRNPTEDVKPKYIYDLGSKITLYGADKLTEDHTTVVITEGELDALVLWSQNIPAVSSTGGALSFQSDWAELLEGKEVYICFDNDGAGAEGMVKALTFLPHAKVILVPEIVGIKDISDYVSHGYDFRSLMATAKQYGTIQEVEDDKRQRDPLLLSTRFHDAYLDVHRRKKSAVTVEIHSKYGGDDAVLRAKSYPLTNFIEFVRYKACCPWHNEKTPSLHYYPKTNSAYCFGSCGRAYDAIDFYRELHHCGFKEAVEELNKLV